MKVDATKEVMRAKTSSGVVFMQNVEYDYAPPSSDNCKCFAC